MWNKPSLKVLAKVPDLYETEGTPLRDKVIHLHFFIGGCDWYAAEVDGKGDICFGFAILNNDRDNAEWGYFSIRELDGIKIGPGFEIDCDLHWEVRPAHQVENIVMAGGAPTERRQAS